MPESVTIGKEALVKTNFTRSTRARHAANARHTKNKIVSISNPAPASDTLPGKSHEYFFTPEHYNRCFNGAKMPMTGSFEIPVIAACLRIDGIQVTADGCYLKGSFGSVCINNIFIKVEALRSLDMSASGLAIEDARLNESFAVMLKVKRGNSQC